MAITDSIANFVDRMRADIAQQEYWNSTQALNELQNRETSDPKVAQRIQEENAAQQDAAMRYLQLMDSQTVRSGREPSPMPASIEAAMGEKGGSPLRPVRREAPDTSKGNYDYGLTPEEEKKYAFANPPRVVSRKQFKTEAEWKAWTEKKQAESAASEANPEGDAAILGKPPEGVPQYGPAAEAPRRTQDIVSQPEFMQASNRGRVNALDVNQMGFGEEPKSQKQPWEILAELEKTGHPLDAQDFRYKLEQQDLAENKRRISEMADRIEATQGVKAAESFYSYHIKRAEDKAKTKPIEESSYFKNAQDYVNNADTRKSIDLMRSFGETLSKAQKQLDRGVSRGDVARFLSANVPKIINFMSTMSTDALQPAEVARIAPELQNYADSGLSFNEWIKLANNRGVFSALFKSPQDFINKSNMIYNSAASSLNKRFDDVRTQVGSAAYGRLGLESMKMKPRSEGMGGMPTRQGFIERGIAPQTAPPAGGVRKSVSMESVYPQ